MSRSPRPTLLPVVAWLFSVVSVTSVASSPVLAADWIHWRGPEQNGVSREKDLPDTWSPKEAGKNNLVWKANVGCRSTPLVMNGKVYVINSAGDDLTEGERVMAFDANTGKVLWEDKFNVWLTDIVSSRVGWTNLAGDKETGNVYAHGTQGLLIAYDGATGKRLWEHSLTEEYGRVSGYGGRAASPIVDGDLVIIGIVQGSWGDFARGLNRFVAFDKKTGAVVWWSNPTTILKGTYYSNPSVAVIGGQRLLVSGGADGFLHAIQVRTGKPVWKYQFGANVINSSPVVAGDLVYCSHGEENLDTNAQGRIICVDGSKTEEKTDSEGNKYTAPKLVWEYKENTLKAGYTTPVLAGDRLYVSDDSAKLYAFDAKTGKQLWRRPYGYGKLARGSGLFADGKLYIFEVNAKFHILKPDDKGCKELHEQFFRSPIPGTFVETNATPAVADGKIYFGTRDEFYCIGKPNWKGGSDSVPAPVEEPKADAAAKPALVQVSPADVVLEPGKSATFTARLYDAGGRFLKEEKAEWSLPLPPLAPLPPGAPPGTPRRQPPALAGKIEDGKLTVNPVPNGQMGYVDAKVGDLVGRARVRVAPTLPYKQDFEKIPVGAPLGGTVNSQGKYEVTELKGGGKGLKKTATNAAPPVARANAYITLPSASNYTIQADLMGERRNNNLPDMGLVNCRYTFILGGNKQQLRIVSWEAIPRIDKTIDFKWEPDTWYTLKLVVEGQGKSAVVRGKVWPRGDAEPSAWTLELTDPSPNLEGSAALYGYATGIIAGDAASARGTEIYYDNVAVTPNGKAAAQK
jgi:outer membrane protein assembly factor BamB